MRSDATAPLGLKLAAGAGLRSCTSRSLFILLYAFTTEDRSYQFPPPGLTLHWFAVAWARARHLGRACGCRCGGGARDR